MTKAKKHQHVVPRSYLRGWADNEDHIAVLDRGETQPRRLSVSNSAVRRRFYNFRGDDDEESDAVEDWLAGSVEGPVAPALRHLRDGADVDDVDRDAVARFTIAQLVRSPTLFSYMDQIDTHLGPLLLMSEAAKRSGTNLLDVGEDGRQRLLEAARTAWTQLPDQDQRASRLRTMSRAFDEHVRLTRNWTWSVLTSPEPCLVSSDCPVVSLDARGVGWAGLIPNGSSLWMPISPTRLLVADPVKPLRSSRALNVELARTVNELLAKGADRALFNHPELPWPTGLVFPRQQPSLPEPQVRWSKSDGPPTFPATFPPVQSEALARLLDVLGAEQIVE